MGDLLSQLIAYLASEMQDVPVSSEVPATKPAAFVVVGPNGGTSDRFVQQPTYSVSAYAGSDFQAASLLEEALILLVASVDAVDLVCQVTIQSSYRDDLEDMSGWTASVLVVANR